MAEKGKDIVRKAGNRRKSEASKKKVLRFLRFGHYTKVRPRAAQRRRKVC